MKLRALAILAVALAMTGCASAPVNQGERFAVEASVVLLIEQSARPAARAAEIVESIDRLQTLLSDEFTTLGNLRGALLRRVADRDLSPGEKALALQVVQRIVESVETKVGNGVLSADSIVTINQVLGWAEGMAALYVPVAS